jgi:hypothetical protein
VLQSQLRDELAELQARLYGWGEIGLGSDACLVSWSEFYSQLLSDAAFQEACPVLYKLLCIVAVMPNGSVENERMFSSLNFIKNDFRAKLSAAHLNAAARIRDQQSKLATPFSQFWLSMGAEFK